MGGSWAVTSGRSPRDSTRRPWVYAAPILLVAVALTQLYLAHTRDLTPWKGGGFGMFASIDGPGARFLEVTLVDADGAEWVVDVEALEGASSSATPAVQRATMMPDERGLRRVIDEVSALAWTPGPEAPVPVATIPGRPPAGTGEAEPPDFIDAVEVRVAVLRLTFDRVAETARAEVISERRGDVS